MKLINWRLNDELFNKADSKNVLTIDGLEYLVNDKVKVYMHFGDIFTGEISEIDNTGIKLHNMYFGYCNLNYVDIKNIILIEN